MSTETKRLIATKPEGYSYCIPNGTGNKFFISAKESREFPIDMAYAILAAAQGAVAEAPATEVADKPAGRKPRAEKAADDAADPAE